MNMNIQAWAIPLTLVRWMILPNVSSLSTILRSLLFRVPRLARLESMSRLGLESGCDPPGDGCYLHGKYMVHDG